MSFVLTSEELAEIRTLRDQGPIDGNSSHVYDKIATIIESRAETDPNNAGHDQGVHAVLTWFKGAKQANSNDGAFSELIRLYTLRQGQLRYGSTFSETRMQDASNAVALSVVSDLLNNNGELPTIAQIAENDATQVGLVLFDQDQTDTAFTNNAAWSGAVLFSQLTSDQTGRLLGNDNSFNSLNDLRDIVFAYDSFKYAFDAISNCVQLIGRYLIAYMDGAGASAPDLNLGQGDNEQPTDTTFPNHRPSHGASHQPRTNLTRCHELFFAAGFVVQLPGIKALLEWPFVPSTRGFLSFGDRRMLAGPGTLDLIVSNLKNDTSRSFTKSTRCIPRREPRQRKIIK